MSQKPEKIFTIFLKAFLFKKSFMCKLRYHFHKNLSFSLSWVELFSEGLSWEEKEKDAQVPDGFPHVEAVQRFGTIRAAPGQLHQSWQPVGNVDELPVLHALLF